MQKHIKIAWEETNMEYYLTLNNETIGPFKKEDIIEKLKLGEISYDTYCWKEGWDEWKLIRSNFPPIPPQLDSGSLPKTSGANRTNSNYTNQNRATAVGTDWAAAVSGLATKNTNTQAPAASKQTDFLRAYDIEKEKMRNAYFFEENDENKYLKLFVGDNYDYFKKKWRLASNPNRFFFWRGKSFNWAAFFFPLPWMAYRKRYFGVFFYILTSILIDLLDTILALPNDLSLWIYAAMPLGVVYGWKCNSWYFSSAKKHIKHSLENIPDSEQRQRYLERKGGTSIGISILATVLWILISVISTAIQTVDIDRLDVFSSQPTLNENPHNQQNNIEVLQLNNPTKLDKFEICINSLESRNTLMTNIVDQSVIDLLGITGGMVVSDSGGKAVSDGGIFLVVNWSYKNITQRPLPAYSKPHICLEDPAGAIYELDYDATIKVQMLENIDEKIISNINPKIKINSAIAFEVSKELFKKDGWKLIIQDQNMYNFKISLPKPMPDVGLDSQNGNSSENQVHSAPNFSTIAGTSGSNKSHADRILDEALPIPAPTPKTTSLSLESIEERRRAISNGSDNQGSSTFVTGGSSKVSVSREKDEVQEYKQEYKARNYSNYYKN